MKLEIEIEDRVYSRIIELMPGIDLAQVMSQMWGAHLIIYATHPEEYMAVFMGQASPEQREIIDEAMKHQATKLIEKSKS